jgi:hypothetical protein
MTRVKGHKYGAVRTEVDGVTFASKAEARRYAELKMLEKAGQINSLELQPKFPITINGVKIATYIADFKYHVGSWSSPSPWIVEDVKGMLTPMYRLKKKMVKAQYGIEITEITR